MSQTCRLMRRLFLCVIVALIATGAAQTVPMTTISDTVYGADGSPAQGTLLISWPMFTTAGRKPIAAGNTSVSLGPGGSLSVSLVPNANATPPATVYTVVYQLDDVVKTEYWIVPTSSPAVLANVRTTLGATSSVAQMATQQFVSSAVAEKADDAAVVHLTGTETISGSKEFSVSPTVPAPIQPSDAANKSYVDSAVQTVGSGSYVSTTGGTMSGPLFLSSDPSAPQQASTKHYTDMATGVKADLLGGLVPATELASGTPGPSTCLLGNQTWGACGSGGGSSSVNGTLVANPNFNSSTPGPQNNFLNCSFQNSASSVSVECPYGNTTSAFALGSQAVLNNKANTYGAGLQDFSAASLKLPSGAGYTPATAGAVGFDTSANSPVININGVTQQLALTTSNISGQASTALALAATPTQCNGSFATGIQANGNANCSVASVIELAETLQPPGIPNYGIFWFDATTHTPRIIDNNGQVAQLALMNVFNSDANTLEEFNGATPQTLNVYGTRTDANNYERLRLGYDTADGYFFLGADAAGSGSQRGLGFWMQGSLRWALDNTFNLKPWADNARDIGAASLRVRNLYLGTGLVFNGGTLTGVRGTSGVAAEAGTLGTTAGAGLCNDGNGNVTDQGCTSGNVSSVFGRSGVVVPQTGDYSVAQITGAAPLASPAFYGTPTAPTPGTADNSTKIATTAWVNAQGYGSGGLSGLTAYASPFAQTGNTLYSSTSSGSVGAFMAANSTTDICTAARALSASFATVMLDVKDGNVGSNTFGGVNNCAGQLFAAAAGPTRGGTVYFSAQRTALTVSAPQQIPSGTALIGAEPIARGTDLDNASGAIIRACNPAYQPCPLGGWSAPSVSIGSESCTAYSSNYYCTITLSAAFPAYPSGVSLSGPRMGRFIQLVSNSGQSSDVIAGSTGANGWFYVLGCAGTPGNFTQCTDTSTTLIVSSSTNFTANCGASCSGTAYLETPLAYPLGNSANRAYQIEIKNILFDCQFLPGCVPFENIAGEEGVILEGVGMYNSSALYWRNHVATCTGWTGGICTNSGTTAANAFGVGTTSGGSSNSGPNFGIEVSISTADCQNSSCGTASNGSHTMTPSAIGQNPDPISPISIGAMWDGPGVGVIMRPTICGTFTTYPAYPETTIATGVIVSGVPVQLSGCHIEKGTTAMVIGGNIAATGTFPGAPTFDVSLTSDHFLTVANGDYGVQIGASENNPLSGAVNPVANISILGNGGTDHSSGVIQTAINDSINGLTVNCSNDGQGYFYLLGYGGMVMDSTGCTGENLIAPAGIKTNILNATTGLQINGTAAANHSVCGNGTNYVDCALSVSQISGAAPLANPAFTGTPAAPTPSAGDSSTRIATTAWVQGQTTGIPWLTVPRGGSPTTVTFSSTANQAALWGVVLQFPVTTSQVTYYAGTADNTANTYDIGIYDNAGNLKAHTGATLGTAFAPATGSRTLSWTGGAVTLEPGRYYLAITTNCSSSCATLDGDNASALTFLNRGIVSVAAGGTLNGPISPPTDAYSWSANTPAWVVR